MTHIRPEQPKDIPAIWQVNSLAFGRPDEANLVDNLRQAKALAVSLVAEDEGQIIGHIAFSPISLEQQPTPGLAAALAPMAVLPDHQKQGIGQQLIRAGLETCRQAGFQIVVVLGHPSYYPKAGFQPASQYHITCPFEVPDEAYMAIELIPGTIAAYRGKVTYHPAFDGV